MRVLKFGGTSVGSPESLRTVKSVVEGRQDPVIVVVSAFSGVTDGLIETARLAESGDESFRDKIAALRARHYDMCSALGVQVEIEDLLENLERICEGIFLLHVLPTKTFDEVQSFGERLSSRIIAKYLGDARLFDSLRFIKTFNREGHHLADNALTLRLIKSVFVESELQGSVVVPGFISTDKTTGDITNLGRGGSDYTASLIAAAIDAECLEIWTDVDGFMTADPRIIKTSYVIDEMTYREATELCNFGAKVIYPPTLYAVCSKGIPVIIKNTFNPSAKGTFIKAESKDATERLITGISSIDDISLITLSATSLVGIVGVDSRIFAALAKENISAFLVSQSASETSISIGVSRKDAEKSRDVLEEAFESEIRNGSISPIHVENELAAVAVVGENMKYVSGIAGKLFSTLGRNNISVLACAQGSSESNISFVVDRAYLRKTLNVIHDSFFLSEYQEVNLFICGIGTVGGQLLDQIASQKETLQKERNLKINVVGIARSTKGIFDRGGIDLNNYKEALEAGIDVTPAKIKEEVLAMNIFNSIFVDCTANDKIAGIYEDLLKHGVSVVAANKIAASSDYDTYVRLKETARDKGVKFLFETNVGAGLPIINTINALRNSGDKILGLEAVLSGTLNFIFNTLSEEVPFSETVRLAKEKGFSEPDPRIDLSGKDVIRKLVILSRESGYKVNQEDVEANLFIPADFFECSLEEFWKKLPSLDADFEARRKELEKKNERWRFVARMDRGKCSVGLETIGNAHSFYSLDGSNNIIRLTTERYNQHPMLIQGYGAGAEVTAAGVFADIMSVANV